MKKAFTKRFVLTLRNFATFRYSQEQGNSRCPAWYVFTPYHIFTPFRREACWCKHILRGVSALLVLLYRAMRRPRSVDGRTVRTPTLYLYNKKSIIKYITMKEIILVSVKAFVCMWIIGASFLISFFIKKIFSVPILTGLLSMIFLSIAIGICVHLWKTIDFLILIFNKVMM